jgi:hypothetical protein
LNSIPSLRTTVMRLAAKNADMAPNFILNVSLTKIVWLLPAG